MGVVYSVKKCRITRASIAFNCIAHYKYVSFKG